MGRHCEQWPDGAGGALWQKPRTHPKRKRYSRLSARPTRHRRRCPHERRTGHCPDEGQIQIVGSTWVELTTLVRKRLETTLRRGEAWSEELLGWETVICLEGDWPQRGQQAGKSSGSFPWERRTGCAQAVKGQPARYILLFLAGACATSWCVHPGGLWRGSGLGIGRSWTRRRLLGSVWVFGMGTVPCVANSHVWHSDGFGQASACEVCVVRPRPWRSRTGP